MSPDWSWRARLTFTPEKHQVGFQGVAVEGGLFDGVIPPERDS